VFSGAAAALSSKSLAPASDDSGSRRRQGETIGETALRAAAEAEEAHEHVLGTTPDRLLGIWLAFAVLLAFVATSRDRCPPVVADLAQLHVADNTTEREGRLCRKRDGSRPP
jgi:hypothetical protein